MDDRPKTFLKMAGGGNDFAVFDDREERIGDPGGLALALTTRRLSVGGDGIILIRHSERASFRMVYHNADGSPAEFCANGTRCAARFAFLHGIAPATMTVETGHAVIGAVIEGDRVSLSIPPPSEHEAERPLALADGSTVRGAYVMVGVPHYVMFVEDELWAREIDPAGREIRSHPDLPLGANVNFVRVRSRSRIEVRTWERGVEAETLSCGSGVVASSIVSVLSGRVDPPVDVLTRSGIVLRVDLRTGKAGIEQVRLTGDARAVYRGELTPETVSGFDPVWVRNPTSSPPKP
ncbi:MAG TPA: diaminopimelate epimerase [Thermoanaerobaculia bacterium]|nr:diaminopimelate epimerase [Thermoanaerobaculia bacterium]